MRLDLIYLAAGNSRRFGGNKLLYPIGGMPMYLHGLTKLSAVCRRHLCWRVTVVTQYPEILKEIKGYPVKAVFSPQSRHGLSYSIKAGILNSELTEDELDEESGFVFFAADQPWMSERTIEKFLSEIEKRKPSLGCVCYGDQLGNPVYFSSSFRDELLSLEKDEGGKKILKKNRSQVYCFQAAEAKELEDLDRREDSGGKYLHFKGKEATIGDTQKDK